MSGVFGAAYRARGVVLGWATALLIGGVLLRLVLPAGPIANVAGVVSLVALIGYVAAVAVSWAGRSRAAEYEDTRAEVWVQPPVRGRWLALNSPATQVPSHGVRGYGQSHAVDLVYAPAGVSRPEFGAGPSMLPATDFPAFGAPVLAMLDGVVERASDWRRDHRSRSTMAAMLYLALEGVVRSIGGPGFVVGNHVVIRGSDGIYGAVAHLRRGSLRVRPGDRVVAGQVIAECGNSGNSTEPHVHAQLMDRRSFLVAQGVPMAFAGITIEPAPLAAASDAERDGDAAAEPAPQAGMPRSGDFIEA